MLFQGVICLSAKLFSKDLKKACLWCAYGKKSDYTEDVFCSKRGVTSAYDSCRMYKYDPLKRTPDKQIISNSFNEDDFHL